MKPKQFIRYTQWLDKRGYAICDGMTQESTMFDILYPLFVITGISLFIILLTKWEWLMDKIRK